MDSAIRGPKIAHSETQRWPETVRVSPHLIAISEQYGAHPRFATRSANGHGTDSQISQRAHLHGFTRPLDGPFFQVCFCNICICNALRGYSGSPVCGKIEPNEINGLRERHRDIERKQRYAWRASVIGAVSCLSTPPAALDSRRRFTEGISA